MSTANYRINLFLLVALVNIKQFCIGHPGGAIVFPKDDDDCRYRPSAPTEKPGVTFDSRLGVLPQSNNSQHGPTYHQQRGGGPTIFKDNNSTNWTVKNTTRVKPTIAKDNITAENSSLSNNTISYESDDDDEEFDPRHTRTRLNCKCKIGNRCAKTDDC